MSRPNLIFLICIGLTFAVWTLCCALMTFVGEPFSLPYVRAFVRITSVLLPAIAYSHYGINTRDDFWAFRRNWQAGLLVGTILSCLFCLLILAQTNTPKRSILFPTNFAVWLNFIVLSPLAEEMMFRRAAQEHLKSQTTTARALILASTLFALLHLPWWLLSGELQGYALAEALLTLFLYGIIFSVAVQATRSIWSALIPHWVNNLLLQSINS